MDFTNCDLCGAAMAPHEHYVVRIDIFADPEMPEVTEAELAAASDGELHRLIEKMRHMSAEELQDQVHRRVEFKICLACHGPFLANPLGKPRITRAATN
ncbi:MAG: hypothetical protein ABSF29_15455 [Tepidisphaeraceae bacterium]|jgi:Zn-finger nucleic acid-binding protein